MNQRSNSRTALFAALALIALSVPAFCKGGYAEQVKEAEKLAEIETFELLKTEIDIYRKLIGLCNEDVGHECTWQESGYKPDENTYYIAVEGNGSSLSISPISSYYKSCGGLWLTVTTKGLSIDNGTEPKEKAACAKLLKKHGVK